MVWLAHIIVFKLINNLDVVFWLSVIKFHNVFLICHVNVFIRVLVAEFYRFRVVSEILRQQVLWMVL